MRSFSRSPSGDVTYTPADEWHWHGATHEHFMAHLSMTQGDVEWGDHVTDAEYRALFTRILNAVPAPIGLGDTR